MKKLVLFFIVLLFAGNLVAQNVFSIKENKTYLNGKPFQAIGLRCANALLSEAATDDLITHLDEYKQYGLNTVSAFFMGSRYSNIYGYNEDATLNATYKVRMQKLIKACDKRGMVVLVGILYWGSEMHNRSNTNYSTWTQTEVNNAMKNTVKWLKDNNSRNVFIDPDNEGMAEIGAKFNMEEMICAGKEVNPEIMIAYNGKGSIPPCANLTVHFGAKSDKIPYIQSEGTPSQYWGEYSKEEGLNDYINIGIYTPGKIKEQLADTKKLLDNGYGYMFSSTWLQSIPPNYNIGENGTPKDPGIKWWFDYIKNNYKK